MKTKTVPLEEDNIIEDATTRRTIIILEDNDERIRDFKCAVALLGPEFQLRLWNDAPTMLRECATVFDDCCLISLDHDLNPMAGATEDPGTGLDVSKFLASHEPFCPVIIHTANYERRWSMHNEFRFAKWKSEIVYPISDHWIQTSWLPKVKALVGVLGK